MSSQIYPSLPGLGIEVVRSYVWNTGYQEALSGKQSTLAFRQYPLVHYELSYSALREPGAAGYGTVTTSELKSLVGLYNQMQGRWDTFLFTDPDFNTISASSPQQFGTGNASIQDFQIVAYYENSGGPGQAEIIQNFNTAPQVYKNGTALTFGTDYTVGPTGIVHFTAVPASGAALTWSGAFYYRCRFDEDAIVWKKFMNKLWSAETKFTSVKL